MFFELPIRSFMFILGPIFYSRFHPAHILGALTGLALIIITLGVRITLGRWCLSRKSSKTDHGKRCRRRTPLSQRTCEPLRRLGPIRVTLLLKLRTAPVPIMDAILGLVILLFHPTAQSLASYSTCANITEPSNRVK